ncbi:MAG TPA: cation diffusion facilitator family transporter [Tepidisphaeraceae bacterium]|nr:cation diffusion facilitator family transporter [Tepidisphaeraceae bacterium]
MTCTERQVADHEKRWAAMTSLWAAVALTSFKVIVGIATGSLGILAEAAHSGLDLIAALVTFLAIRASSKPADREHLYGHGKIENLSALFETLLLLLTCVWIFYEAGHRLSSGQEKVEVNGWSFAVMITSIVIDYSRSRALGRAAQKHNSQALEADALHFQTDIWSSLAVIGGLFCVKLSQWVPSLRFLHFADAAAAIIVALIVVWVSMQLGMRTIHALLDTAPQGMENKIIAAAEAVPGVCNCHNVRVRSSGPQLFVDAHVLVDGQMSLAQAHELTERVENAIQQVAPHADVTVHPEPTTEPAKSC